MSAKKPLKYESGKHVPFEANDTLDLSSIPLSSSAGNRIEVRGDGIGVWDTAPPNLTNQYIDAVNGDDTNAGTRDKPLKTVAKALSRIVTESSAYGTFIIRLKSGQLHNVTQRLAPMPNATLLFTTYDDPMFGNLEGVVCPGKYAWDAIEAQRATLQINVIPSPGYETQYTYIPTIIAKEARFYGVNIRRNDGQATFPGTAQFVIQTSNITHCQGCNIYIGQFGQFARPGSVWLQSCWLTMHPEAYSFLSPLDNPVITSDGSRSPESVATEKCPGMSWRNVGDNVRQVLTADNIGFSVNKERKQILNGGTNWDIFA